MNIVQDVMPINENTNSWVKREINRDEPFNIYAWNRKKNLLNYTEGAGTGRECGPFHYHGFQGIELKVANDIAMWINQ